MSDADARCAEQGEAVSGYARVVGEPFVMTLRAALLVAALYALVLVLSCESKRWSPEELQNPKQSTFSACNRKYRSLSSVCDPSGLISREQRYTIDRAISALEAASHDGHGACKSYKVGATVVRYMATDGYTSVRKMAARMAKAIFTEWHLGDCGVLLFASTGDRRVYIAVGSSARRTLSSNRLQKVITHMSTYFSRGDSGRAVLVGVQDVGKYLFPRGHGPAAEKSKHVGEEQPGLLGWELTVTLTVAALALVVACCNGVGGPERARFNALMDSKRCALCLERFHAPSVTAPATGEDTQSPSSEPDAARDTAEEVVLPCGHTFHRTQACWRGWSATSQECPLCQVADGAATLIETEKAGKMFRLQRIATLYPELQGHVTDEIQKLETRRVRQINNVRTGYSGQDHHSGPGLGWMLGAGAAGAALGSVFSGGWGNGQHTNSAPPFWGNDQQVSGDGGGWGGPSMSLGGAGGGWSSHFGGGDGGGWGGGGGGGASGDGGGW